MKVEERLCFGDYYLDPFEYDYSWGNDVRVDMFFEIERVRKVFARKAAKNANQDEGVCFDDVFEEIYKHTFTNLDPNCNFYTFKFVPDEVDCDVEFPDVCLSYENEQ